MRDGKHTVLTRTLGGHHPPLQPRSRSDSPGHGPERRLTEPSERARARPSRAGAPEPFSPGPAERAHGRQLPHHPGILPPARAAHAPGPPLPVPRQHFLPTPREPPARCLPSRRWFLPGAALPPPGPRQDGSCPGPSSPALPNSHSLPPRKYSAHKYGG